MLVVMADSDYDLSAPGAAAAMQAVFRKAELRSADRRTMHAFSADRGTISHAERLPGTAAEAGAIDPKLASKTKHESTLYLDRYALEEVFKAFVWPRCRCWAHMVFFRPINGGLITTNDVAKILGVKQWPVRRLFEPGDPPGLAKLARKPSFSNAHKPRPQAAPAARRSTAIFEYDDQCPC